MSRFLLIFGMITERFGHDHLSLGISFGLKSHFFHLLSQFFLINFLLILFFMIFIHDFSSVSIHNNSVLGVMLHLKVLPCIKIKSTELVSDF